MKMGVSNAWLLLALSNIPSESIIDSIRLLRTGVLEIKWHIPEDMIATGLSSHLGINEAGRRASDSCELSPLGSVLHPACTAAPSGR